jgi:hypothetical protein
VVGLTKTTEDSPEAAVHLRAKRSSHLSPSAVRRWMHRGRTWHQDGPPPCSAADPVATTSSGLFPRSFLMRRFIQKGGTVEVSSALTESSYGVREVASAGAVVRSSPAGTRRRRRSEAPSRQDPVRVLPYK